MPFGRAIRSIQLEGKLLFVLQNVLQVIDVITRKTISLSIVDNYVGEIKWNVNFPCERFIVLQTKIVLKSSSTIAILDFNSHKEDNALCHTDNVFQSNKFYL